MLGTQIAMDNILQQIKLSSPHQLKFYGNSYPLYTQGRAYYDSSFVENSEQYIFMALCYSSRFFLRNFLDPPDYITEKFQKPWDQAEILERLKEEVFTQASTEDQLHFCITEAIDFDYENSTNVMFLTAKTDQINHSYGKSHIYNFF